MEKKKLSDRTRYVMTTTGTRVVTQPVLHILIRIFNDNNYGAGLFKNPTNDLITRCDVTAGAARRTCKMIKKVSVMAAGPIILGLWNFKSTIF